MSVTAINAFVQGLSTNVISEDAMPAAEVFQESFKTGKKVVIDLAEAEVLGENLDILQEKIDFLRENTVVDSEYLEEGIGAQLFGDLKDGLSLKDFRDSFKAGSSDPAKVKAFIKDVETAAIKAIDSLEDDTIPEAALDSWLAQGQMPFLEIMLIDKSKAKKMLEEIKKGDKVTIASIGKRMKEGLTSAETRKYMVAHAKTKADFKKLVSETCSNASALIDAVAKRDGKLSKVYGDNQLVANAMLSIAHRFRSTIRRAK